MPKSLRRAVTLMTMQGNIFPRLKIASLNIQMLIRSSRHMYGSGRALSMQLRSKLTSRREGGTVINHGAPSQPLGRSKNSDKRRLEDRE